MNDSPRKVSPLRLRMLEEMRMRQLAPKTRDAYIRAVLHFTRFLGRSPDTATAEDLRRYQLHCVDQGGPCDHAERDDHGTEVLVRCHPGQARVDGQDAPRAHVPHFADYLKSRGSEPPA